MDETPVEYRVTFAIGDFQKSLRFNFDGLLHTAINFGPACLCKAVPCVQIKKRPPIFDECDIRMSLGSDRMTGHKLFPFRSSLSRELIDDLSRIHGQFCLVTNSYDQLAVL